MPMIHVPNPTFETELEGSPRKLPQAVAELVDELSLLSGLAAARDDVILVNRPVPRDQLPASLQTGRYLTEAELQRELGLLSAAERQRWRLCPWGWSPSAIRLVRTLDLAQSVPDPQAVRWVNTREFAAGHDVTVTETGELCESRFGWLCRSEAEVLAALQACQQAGDLLWVIKANISHAARNRLLGAGAVLTASQLQWLQRRLAAGECVSVEPWVERIAECGLQWSIGDGDREAFAGESSTTIEFSGACVMLTDGGGEYRGSVIRRTAAALAWWRPAELWGRRIVERAAACGFRGPLGIDCMLLRRRGRLELRVAHDINGRQTMGRLALAFRPWLGTTEVGVWCHPTAVAPEIHQERLREIADSGVTVHSTSPTHWDGRAARLQTCLLISEDTEHLQQAVATLNDSATAWNCLREVRPQDGVEKGRAEKGVRNQ
jgi:hypothetical protein